MWWAIETLTHARVPVTMFGKIVAGVVTGVLTAGEIAVIGQTTGASAWLRPQRLETIGDTARERAGA